ncbi:unnamed protein product [Diabrotica balteata]|uniref:Uncharacterized protein n=1 Tax=Diabrotica balteata TaxID=107213 RepID=A0A9N9X606_DIABA|nr:unnamed protein product [Diabrotica balteata]
MKQDKLTHLVTALVCLPGETPPRSPSSPASSPIAGISSRSVSPSSPRSPITTSRHSAFSLVYPKDLHRNKHYLTVNGMNALMYANSLNPLVTSPYPSYMWHPIPGLFLPYSPAHRPESLSPDRTTVVDQGFTEKSSKKAILDEGLFKEESSANLLASSQKRIDLKTSGISTELICTDEDAPLNLSLKGRSRTHNIWSPGSLCEQEMKTTEIRPDSSVSTTIISPVKTIENRWKCW